MAQAQHACYKCGNIYPQNLMKRWSQKVKVGENVSRDVHDYSKSHATITERYANEVRWYCKTCSSGKWVVNLFGWLFIALVAFVIIGLIGQHDQQKSIANSSSDANQSIAASGVTSARTQSTENVEAAPVSAPIDDEAGASKVATQPKSEADSGDAASLTEAN